MNVDTVSATSFSVEKLPFKVVIPARYASSRLPGKPLADINGLPMIVWVQQAAELSGAEQVVIATDDSRVVEVVEQYGGHAVMTRADHVSGTDRLAEVADQMRWPNDTLVVNVQGDEPGMSPALIDQVAALLQAHSEAGVASLYTLIEDPQEWRNPNAVKVVTDQKGRALYFSRAAIPHDRDGCGSVDGAPVGKRHIGLYAYRVSALRAFVAWPPAPLEQLEKLEQLRFMEQGVEIAMAQATLTPPAGVDTPDDLAWARRTLGRKQEDKGAAT